MHVAYMCWLSFKLFVHMFRAACSQHLRNFKRVLCLCFTVIPLIMKCMCDLCSMNVIRYFMHLLQLKTLGKTHIYPNSHQTNCFHLKHDASASRHGINTHARTGACIYGCAATSYDAFVRNARHCAPIQLRARRSRVVWSWLRRETVYEAGAR